MTRPRQNNLADTNPEKLAKLTALLENTKPDALQRSTLIQWKVPIQIDKTLADEAAEDDVVAWWPN